MTTFPPEAPQDYYDYFHDLALHAEPPSPKWAKGLEAAELWMAYNLQDTKHPDSLIELVQVLTPYNNEGSILYDLWGVVMQATHELPVLQQTQVWRAVFSSINQDANLLSNTQRAETVLQQWETMAEQPTNMSVNPNDVSLLVQIFGSDWLRSHEWIALAYAIDNWLTAHGHGAKFSFVHIVMEQHHA